MVAALRPVKLAGVGSGALKSFSSSCVVAALRPVKLAGVGSAALKSFSGSCVAAALLPVKLGSAALKSFSGSCTYTVVAVLFTVISLEELAAVALGTMASNVLGTPLPFEMKLAPGWAV